MGRVAVTVGLDIGTTSIKAVAVDDDGTVVARTRVPHEVRVVGPEFMEHDADRAWRRGPRRALAALGAVDPSAVAVAAMVPSLTAVNRAGKPLTAGLLYGDARGRADAGPSTNPADASGGGEVTGFLKWSAAQAPQASGFWPAQSVANKALGGAPAIDWAVAYTSAPLWGTDSWDAQLCADCGIDPSQLPPAELPGTAVGRVGGAKGGGPLLTVGTVDVWCEQLVAGANAVGDVHVICGTTLIIWTVVATEPGAVSHPDAHAALWTVPQGPDSVRVGGASNAGGLFVDWVRRAFPTRGSDRPLDPGNVPVWTPYVRGERTPYHDPSRRAALHDLNLTHGPAQIHRAAWEASGFVVRHHLDLAGAEPKRIVATGGGTRVEDWMQCLADTTGLPVHVAASPEGAARGAAFLGRMAAGLESDFNGAERWASTREVVDPDPVWQAAAGERYQRFLELSGRP